MEVKFHQSIAQIAAQDWDALWQTKYPFTQHAFFKALEESNSVDTAGKQNTGWQPKHLSIEENGKIIAVMPLFVKGHSYGEYVFDWSWADAYHQAGIEYYPKLLNAIPFTPATGPRIGFSKDLSNEQKQSCNTAIIEAIKNCLKEENMSGFHSLFPQDNSTFEQARFTERQGYQFHWFNQGFKDFDDFLNSFSSRKRKNLKKERQKVFSQDLDIRMRHADELTTEEWNKFYALYHRTYLKRSGRTGYLGPDFFHRLGHEFPQQVLVCSAHHQNNMIAAALYLRDEDTLYGRYWGTQIDLDGLHFECCYYQGIEYAIQHQLKRFDPGAQGEHKIQRGFTPIKTRSYHWLSHPSFNGAINEFTQQEIQHINAYIKDTRTLMPFKEGVETVEEDYLFTF
ncbi:GNAT family N-acetyltransferase [Agarilytica rhodophyticola]|uniref:GNAT family N-acetyltransferase n=1 Tax=Agarilytica rhodophyticola TaxID=1737490 RepID=UPI000B3412D8|nr:GNAT family N-acetyltransferase [Agarilytica rhodophyticola]